MFDIGFTELLVIAVVALIVLGPERLPKAARFAGLWVRRARAQWYSVKSELERDLASEELQRSLRETQASLRAAESELQAGGQQLRREFESLQDDVRQDAGADPSASTGSTPSAPAPAPQAPTPPDDDDARR